jgi:hypothetical protein
MAAQTNGGGVGLLAILGIIWSGIASIWVTFKYLISQNSRLDDNLSKTMVKEIKKNSRFNFVVNNEFLLNKKYPRTYSSVTYIDGVFIYFYRGERLLTAGWQSKETLSEIYFLRWQRKKVEKLLDRISNIKETINVLALTPYGADKLGEYEINENPKVYIEDEQYKDIEDDVIKMIDQGHGKTSCLLYGKPGTGKTRLIKYFSQKYNMPVYSVFLNPEYTNLEVMFMFESIPQKSIVLFEDFDNYFNKRECTIKSEHIKFTFDSILSVLDGVYNDYNQILFVMTCNDIEKMDDSLKNRPSRFKYVREIKPPNFDKRLELLGDMALAAETNGLTLDKIFFFKSMIGKYTTEEILKKIEEDRIPIVQPSESINTNEKTE